MNPRCVICICRFKLVQKMGLTKEKINKIIEEYNSGIPPKKIAEKYNIHSSTVNRVLRRNNISPNQKINISNQQSKYICEKYLDGINSEKIAKELKINPSTVCRILKKNNIKIRNNSSNKRKFKINENWLDVIGPAQAYFLGLFLADGNISKSKNDICLRLHSQDKLILEKLSMFFYKQNRIKSYVEDVNKKSTPVSRLCLYSKSLKEKLNEIGITPNKAKSAEIPSIIDVSLMSHFLRGLLDGDGCICIRKNKRYTVDYTGNDKVINKLYQILKAKNIYSSVYYNKPKNSWSLQINRKRDINVFLEWIYEDSNGLYIRRKYNKYEEIKRLQNAR